MRPIAFSVFFIVAASAESSLKTPVKLPPPQEQAASKTEIKLKLSAKEIIIKSQELLRGAKSSHARLAMTLTRPSFARKMEIESYQQGTQNSFIVIHKPAKEQGNRTLRLGRDIWSYTREAEQVIKIPFSMMQTNWMGSDFTYEDMTRFDSYVNYYDHAIVKTETDPQRISDYLVTIELIPRADAPVIWGRVVWKSAVSADGREVIQVSEEDYNERGELVRQITLDNVKIMGGKRMPTKITCRAKKKKNQETVLEYKTVAFDSDLDAKIFTKETLEKGLQ
ncbi:MAG: outer membrane lipoprotein-sorting protein [Elusimicrobia bacterium]|nr:outer membrane lipoprotein-sorting protein [Elusimicrobiota bacterium]